MTIIQQPNFSIAYENLFAKYIGLINEVLDANRLEAHRLKHEVTDGLLIEMMKQLMQKRTNVDPP